MMKRNRDCFFGIQCLTLLIAAILTTSACQAQSPPFSGAAFIDPDLITPADPSTFQSSTAKGQGVRNVFDYRTGNFANTNGYLYTLKFSDGPDVEAWVNTEFGASGAATQAQKYGAYVGQMPRVIRNGLQQLWIHAGNNSIGANNPSGTIAGHIVIHTGRAEAEIANGTIEEVFLHEGAHLALDPVHENTSAWANAVAADPTYISTYARDNSGREDIAESWGAWFAVRQRAGNISNANAKKILEAIPNRLRFFDNLNLSMAPQRTHSVMTSPTSLSLNSSTQQFSWTRPSGLEYSELIGGTGNVGSANVGRSGTISGTSYNLANIPTNGSDLFVRLWSKSNGVWGYGEYLFKTSTSAPPSNPNAGTITNPAPGSNLGTGWTWFYFNNPASGGSVEHWDILVGTMGAGSGDVKGSDVRPGSDYGQWVYLNTNSKLYVRLWTRVGGSWFYNDFTYN